MIVLGVDRANLRPLVDQLQEAIARANFAGHIIGRGKVEKDAKRTLLQKMVAKFKGGGRA